MNDPDERAAMLGRLPSDRFTLTFGDETDGPILLEQAFDQTRMAMCVTDPNLPDNPIVYVNRAFEELTGYAEAEIVGRNCRFLQGERTEPAALAELRQAIAAETVCILEILNYRKNGDAFWNALHIGPIYDEKGKLRFYFGSQWDVTNVHAARVLDQQVRTINQELNHRIKNLFAVIGSIVSLSANGANDAEEATSRARQRIVALGRAHEATINPTHEASTAYFATLVEEVLAPFRDVTRASIDASGDAVTIQISAITPLGLILHELATNSLKYGSLGGHGDALELEWRLIDVDGAKHLRLVWRDRSGKNAAADGAPGMGSRIIDAMAHSFSGRYETGIDGEWYEATVLLPAPAVVLPEVLLADQALRVPGR